MEIIKAPKGNIVYDDNKNFTGCYAEIFDLETNEIIDRTRIISHDRKFHIIKMESNAKKEILKRVRISVVIFSSDKPFQFFGTARKSMGFNALEVALFQGREKEGRKYGRYDVNIAGVVDAIKTKTQLLEIARPLEIEVLNVSVGGMLIKTYPYCFDVGSAFRVKLSLNGNAREFSCIVMRVLGQTSISWQYGCEFIDY